MKDNLPIKSVSISDDSNGSKPSKSIRIEKISNGYIICTESCYPDKKNYEDRYKIIKEFSPTNPFAEDSALDKEVEDKFKKGTKEIKTDKKEIKEPRSKMGYRYMD